MTVKAKQDSGAAERLAETPPEPRARSLGHVVGSLLRRPEAGALIGTVGVFVFFAVFGGAYFVSLPGVASWMNVAAELGIIALPVGLLMIAGELDLSVGGSVAAGGMTLAIVTGYWDLPIALGIASGLGVGLLIGLINGLLVTRTNVPSLIITLATNFCIQGLVLFFAVIIIGTTTQKIVAGDTAKTLLATMIGNQYEIAILWWIGALLVVGWVLHVSKYGNWILAVGGDKESATAAGIPAKKLKVRLYMSTGLAAAFIGTMQAVLYNSAQTAAGQGFMFSSIVAVVIGGVLLTGGYGSVFGIALGTLTFAIVTQGIYYTSWDANLANLILGILLLAAVVMNSAFRRAALSRNPASRLKHAKG